MPGDTTLELRLLGRFIVLRDGSEIPAASFGGRKVRALLRILATRRGQFVGHDLLTEMLWPDRPPADPSANLQVLVNRIRRATNCPSLILTGPGGYAFSPDPMYLVDSERFVNAVSAGDLLTGRAALTAYRVALAQFSGEPLAEDRYADWAQPYRERLLRARQDALERAAQLAMVQGDGALGVEYAAAAAAAEPLREVAALTLAGALAAAGDRAAALEPFDRFRRALADDLGLDPSPAAAALHARLLEGAVEYDGAAFTREPSDFGVLRFVGRDRERDVILAGMSAGEGGVVTIAGRSGSGKSRLIDEVVSSSGAVLVRAYWPERSEPWSLARAVLREFVAADITTADGLPPSLRDALCSIVPEIEHPTSGAVDPESRRALIFEAAIRLAGSMADIVLVVDDLQWADPSSALLLAALLDRVPRLAMVLAYRPEEIAPAGEVAEFLRRLEGAQTVHLAGLDDPAINGLTDDRALAAALARGTDRTPLAISEVLRALAREGVADCDARGRWRSRSPEAAGRAAELGALGQRRAIARRAEKHSGDVAETLGLLALLARQVPARTLAAASGVVESATLDALTALCADGLARLGEEGWATAHDMVGEVVADRLARDERGRLHGLIARALEAQDADAAERARHWLSAGDAAKAAEAYAHAATRALDACADSEAQALADAGLAGPTAPGVEARLREVRAQARRRRGDIAGARADLRAALALHRIGQARAGVLAQLATLASGADDLVRASELVELAIVEAGEDPLARAEALEVAAVLDMNLDRSQRAESRAAEALASYQREGDSRGAARVLDARAMATFLDGDIRTGTELLHRAANLFEDSGDLMRLVTPRSTRGHGLVFLGRPREGLADASAALEAARSLGHPEGQAYSLWHRSEALSAVGESGLASCAGREALAIAQRIGHRGWTATAWRAIGIAEQSHGDLDAARRAFDNSAVLSENLDLFRSWAAARGALVRVAMGLLDDAEPLVVRALSTGPPLGRYEARLARVELAVARLADDAVELATAALRQAESGGMIAHRERLTVIVNGPHQGAR